MFAHALARVSPPQQNSCRWLFGALPRRAPLSGASEGPSQLRMATGGWPVVAGPGCASSPSPSSSRARTSA
eukprot:14617210-Alexandrium_andersonii.AAC.1